MHLRLGYCRALALSCLSFHPRSLYRCRTITYNPNQPLRLVGTFRSPAVKIEQHRNQLCTEFRCWSWPVKSWSLVTSHLERGQSWNLRREDCHELSSCNNVQQLSSSLMDSPKISLSHQSGYLYFLEYQFKVNRVSNLTSYTETTRKAS